MKRALGRKWLTLDSIYGPVDVRLVPDLVDDNGESVDGLFLPESFSIHIESKQTSSKRHSTLLHEMMHLVFASARTEKVVEDNEEAFVTFVEPVLFDLLRRNGFLRMLK